MHFTFLWYLCSVPKTKSQKRKDPMDQQEILDLVAPMTGSICEVDVLNQMTDGTQMTGFVVTFHYADGSTSQANAVGPWGSGGGAKVYSQDKCVSFDAIQIGARRPDNTVQIIPGQDPPAPPHQCYQRTAWGLVPAHTVNSSDRKSQQYALIEARRR